MRRPADLWRCSASLRQLVTEGDAKLLETLGNVRVEQLKWTIALWMGHVLAVAGLIGLMLRFMRA